MFLLWLYQGEEFTVGFQTEFHLEGSRASVFVSERCTEHTVWGSLVGSACTAHGGRTSGGGQGSAPHAGGVGALANSLYHWLFSLVKIVQIPTESPQRKI